MPTPAKPYVLLKNEKKSHRTKAELLQRKQGEEALLSGVALVERPEVKKNKIAHREFKRVNALLENIEKNDAIYETVINRYCIIQAECDELTHEMNKITELINKLEEKFDKTIESTEPKDRAKLVMQFGRSMSDFESQKLDIDKQIQAKRKMLLDIEKENVMTIKAALQTIPKKQETKQNALLEVLGGGKT